MSGAIAAGFVFVVAASVVSAFARIPGQGVRARLLVAFNYATFYMAVALLFGMVCLLLLARSAARGGLAQVTASGSAKSGRSGRSSPPSWPPSLRSWAWAA